MFGSGLLNGWCARLTALILPPLRFELFRIYKVFSSQLQVLSPDLKLNGIVGANVEDVLIPSPPDGFVKRKEGTLCDYQWVDIGHVHSSPQKLHLAWPQVVL